MSMMRNRRAHERGKPGARNTADPGSGVVRSGFCRKFRLRSSGCGALLWVLSCTYAYAGAVVPWSTQPYFISATNAKVATVVRDLGAASGVPVIVSDAVDDQFAGVIRDELPGAIIKRLTRLFQLATYYDGHALYVYKSAEVSTRLVTSHYLDPHKIMGYLDHSGVAAQEYCSARVVADFKAVEIFGVPACLSRVAGLVTDLDTKVMQRDANEEVVKVFPLTYADAADSQYTYRDHNINVPGVANVLRNMAQSGALVSAPASAVMALTPSGDRGPSFSADSSSNAVVVRARKINMPLYAELIRELDIKPVPVQISVTIIDVDAGDVDALGIDWSGSIKAAGVGIGFNTANGVLNTVVNNTTNFMIKVNALEQHSKARILSRPSIMTLNNRQAVLDRNITFYTKLQGNHEVKLESVSTGSLLRVTPRLVTDSGGATSVMLTLDIEDGRQAPAISATESLPQVQASEIATQAMLKAGQSLLLGGFIQDEKTQGERGIPLLGKIPVLGQLFKSANTEKRSMLRLFLIKAQPQPQSTLATSP